MEDKPKLRKKESVSDVFRRRSTSNFRGVGGFLDRLTPQQDEILAKVKLSIADEDYPEKDGSGVFRLDDATVLRFLRAQNFNGYKATMMIKEHLAFRRKWKPHTLTGREKGVSEILETGFWTVPGHTKDHNPFELIVAKKFNPNKFQGDGFTKAMIFIREKVATMIAEQKKNPTLKQNDTFSDEFVLRDRTLLLIDASEWSFLVQGTVNGMRLIKVIVDLLQAHWPETLGVAAIVNAPATFRWAFAVIRRWLDEEIASRISFVTNFEELHELIDPSVLSKKYGGLLEDDDPRFNDHSLLGRFSIKKNGRLSIGRRPMSGQKPRFDVEANKKKESTLIPSTNTAVAAGGEKKN
jgi:hypothetical protein